MAGGMDWFRWHHGTTTDPKFGLVAKKAGVSVAEVLGVWAYLLESASESTERGQHGQIDWEAVANHLGMTEESLGAVYEQLCERGMVDYESQRITAWERRQPKREREDDSSTERSRVHRQRQKEQGNAMQRHATPTDAMEHAGTPRGEEKRGEQPPSDEGGAAPRKRASAPSRPEDVNEQTWADWLQLRKSKKAPVTETVLKGARSEAAKAGLTLEQFLQVWCTRGSQGLQADWLKPEERRQAAGSVQAAARHTDSYEETQRLLAERNRGTSGMPAEIRQFAAQLTGRKAA